MCEKSAIFSLTSANRRLVSPCLVLILLCGTSLLNISPPEAFFVSQGGWGEGKKKARGGGGGGVGDGKGEEKKKRSCLYPLPILHCSRTIFDFIGLASFISWR